jgi:hypothetical protein
MSESASSDAAGAAAADDPGRPRGKDELDPELIRLPRKRTRIGPVLAGSLIVLSLVMMWRLRGDLVFSRQDDAPVAVDLAAAAAASPDSYVELDARPDRVAALHVFPSRASDGHRLMPALGAGGAVWLMVDGDPWDEAPVARERYVGRVGRLGAMPFYDELKTALAAAPPSPVAIDAPALRAALEGNAAALADPSGEAVPLDPELELAVSETVAGKALITASAIETHPDEMAWQAALIRAGIAPPGTGPVSGTPASWTFAVPAPDGVDGVAAALVAARLYATRAEPMIVQRTARWGELAASDEGLVVAGATVPWTSVSSVSLAARRRAPDPEARVIVGGQAPGDFWYVLPIYLVLGLFALLFGWGLWQALRAARPAAAPPPVA